MSDTNPTISDNDPRFSTPAFREFDRILSKMVSGKATPEEITHAQQYASNFLEETKALQMSMKEKIINLMSTRKAHFDSLVGHQHSSNAVAECMRLVEGYFPPLFFEPLKEKTL